jgi:hypothetical protein
MLRDRAGVSALGRRRQATGQPFANLRELLRAEPFANRQGPPEAQLKHAAAQWSDHPMTRYRGSRTDEPPIELSDSGRHRSRPFGRTSISFPTFLDITFQVRTALKNPQPDRSSELGTNWSAAEPLMSTKVIRLANSAAINRSGTRPIVDMNSAIGRVGMEAVRTVSFAVAMEQLLNSKKMAAFQTLSRRLWEHTMYVAALARVLARRLTRVNVR